MNTTQNVKQENEILIGPGVETPERIIARDSALQTSLKHPTLMFYVWVDLDSKTYYFDNIPIPLHRERVTDLIQNGKILKQKRFL